jgi:hypothetical protein
MEPININNVFGTIHYLDLVHHGVFKIIITNIAARSESVPVLRLKSEGRIACLGPTKKAILRHSVFGMGFPIRLQHKI